MYRLLSNHVIVDGVDKGLSIVTIDAKGQVVEISNFDREEAFVTYIDGPIAIKRKIDGLFELEEKKILDLLFD